jgi:hypothetical protein
MLLKLISIKKRKNMNINIRQIVILYKLISESYYNYLVNICNNNDTIVQTIYAKKIT